nr:putative zinc finger, CCHC-type, retrotransposon Gag domain protein [Tanacetum cinerariifolium]
NGWLEEDPDVDEEEDQEEEPEEEEIKDEDMVNNEEDDAESVHRGVIKLSKQMHDSSQTNPQPTLTQEAVDQLVRDRIEATIRDERERVRIEATRAGGPAGGLTATPMARECSFTGFMKCGPTQFYETESTVELVCWFEKIENTFEISECVEGKKVKFATATLHGRALTWWNSQVATLG